MTKPIWSSLLLVLLCSGCIRPMEPMSQAEFEKEQREIEEREFADSRKKTNDMIEGLKASLQQMNADSALLPYHIPYIGDLKNLVDDMQVGSLGTGIDLKSPDLHRNYIGLRCFEGEEVAIPGLVGDFVNLRSVVDPQTNAYKAEVNVYSVSKVYGLAKAAKIDFDKELSEDIDERRKEVLQSQKDFCKDIKNYISMDFRGRKAVFGVYFTLFRGEEPPKQFDINLPDTPENRELILKEYDAFYAEMMELAAKHPETREYRTNLVQKETADKSAYKNANKSMASFALMYLDDIKNSGYSQDHSPLKLFKIAPFTEKKEEGK